MGKNVLWEDLGAVSDGLFAKHKYRCIKCNEYETESRGFPKEMCPVCAADMEAKAEYLKRMFNK